MFLYNTGCSLAVEPVSRMAVSWNIPHIIYSGSDELLGNKRIFSMLTRTGMTMNGHVKIYLDILDKYKWTNVAIIYDVSNFVHNLNGENLKVIILQQFTFSHTFKCQ